MQTITISEKTQSHSRFWVVQKGKGKGQILLKRYLQRDATTSRAVQSQEVAVDWQDPMVWERNAAATTHTTTPINHTRPSPSKHSPDGASRARKQTSDHSLLLSLSTSRKIKGWVDLRDWLHTEIKCRLRELNPDTPPIPVLTGLDVE